MNMRELSFATCSPRRLSNCIEHVETGMKREGIERKESIETETDDRRKRSRTLPGWTMDDITRQAPTTPAKTWMRGNPENMG